MLMKLGRPGARLAVINPSREVFRLTEVTSNAGVADPAGGGACWAASATVVSTPVIRSSVFIEKPRQLDARPDRLVGAAAPCDDTLSTTDVGDTQGRRSWFRLSA